MNRLSNADQARIYLDELPNFTGFGDFAENFIAAAQVYALLDVADAIREHTARTTHPAGSSR